jgi:hypothetical protein
MLLVREFVVRKPGRLLDCSGGPGCAWLSCSLCLSLAGGRLAVSVSMSPVFLTDRLTVLPLVSAAFYSLGCFCRICCVSASSSFGPYRSTSWCCWCYYCATVAAAAAPEVDPRK